MKALIIVPAYNEEGNIGSVIKDYEKISSYADILVVDDCSTDGTREELEKSGINHISLPINLGIGGAVQAGYVYAEKYGYDFAVQADGDGQHDMSYIPKMLEILQEDGADIVIGSRFIKKEGFQSYTVRRMGIKCLSTLIWMCTGKKIYDVTSGFRAVNKRFIRFYSDYYPDDYPEPEAIAAALMYKGRISEIPVIMRERKKGKSSINLYKSVYYMIKVSLAIILIRTGLKIGRIKD